MRTLFILLLLSAPCCGQSIFLESLRTRQTGSEESSKQAANAASRQADAAIRESNMLSKLVREMRLQKKKRLEVEIANLKLQLAETHEAQLQLKSSLSTIGAKIDSLSKAVGNQEHDVVQELAVTMKENWVAKIQPMLDSITEPQKKGKGETDPASPKDPSKASPASPGKDGTTKTADGAADHKR